MWKMDIKCVVRKTRWTFFSEVQVKVVVVVAQLLVSKCASPILLQAFSFPLLAFSHCFD